MTLLYILSVFVITDYVFHWSSSLSETATLFRHFQGVHRSLTDYCKIMKRMLDAMISDHFPAMFAITVTLLLHLCLQLSFIDLFLIFSWLKISQLSVICNLKPLVWRTSKVGFLCFLYEIIEMVIFFHQYYLNFSQSFVPFLAIL